MLGRPTTLADEVESWNNAAQNRAQNQTLTDAGSSSTSLLHINRTLGRTKNLHVPTRIYPTFVLNFVIFIPLLQHHTSVAGADKMHSPFWKVDVVTTLGEYFLSTYVAWCSKTLPLWLDLQPSAIDVRGRSDISDSIRSKPVLGNRRGTQSWYKASNSGSYWTNYNDPFWDFPRFRLLGNWSSTRLHQGRPQHLMDDKAGSDFDMILDLCARNCMTWKDKII